MPSSLPRRNHKVHLSLTSPWHWPSLSSRKVGFRISLFEASSNVHLRYGLESSPSHLVTRCLEGSDKFVSSLIASIATGQATLPRRDLHPLKLSCLHGARLVSENLLLAATNLAPNASLRARQYYDGDFCHQRTIPNCWATFQVSQAEIR